MKCRYFLYIAELTILDCSATGCNRVRWNLTQSWGRKSHIHWHTCQLTEIDRSVTVCLTVTLYFSQTVCLCFCWLKKRVQVLAPAQTKNEKKKQSSLQNKLFLGNVPPFGAAVVLDLAADQDAWNKGTNHFFFTCRQNLVRSWRPTKQNPGLLCQRCNMLCQASTRGMQLR